MQEKKQKQTNFKIECQIQEGFAALVNWWQQLFFQGPHKELGPEFLGICGFPRSLLEEVGQEMATALVWSKQPPHGRISNWVTHKKLICSINRHLKIKLHFTYYFNSYFTSHVTSLFFLPNKQIRLKLNFSFFLFQSVISEELSEVIS